MMAQSNTAIKLNFFIYVQPIYKTLIPNVDDALGHIVMCWAHYSQKQFINHYSHQNQCIMQKGNYPLLLSPPFPSKSDHLYKEKFR